MDKDEVIERINAHRNELRAMGVKSLALFGSTARGEARTDSDVDLLVEFDRPVGFEYFDVHERLQVILGHANVDLVVREAVVEALQYDIFTEAIDAF